MNLYFDLGTEIKSTTTEAIFLSPTTFRKLRIEPNFRLLFCNIISNYNSNQISIQNDLVFQYGFVEKFNFYSLIEDNFAKIRKIPYLPLRSLKLAENGIENYIYKKNSVKIAYPELEPIKESLTSLSCLGYRFEIRVKGLFIGSGINFLHSLFNPSSFVSIFYSTFLFIVNANLNIFNHSIKGNKLKDFQRNIIIETIFKEFFIKGSYNNHFLPSTLNLKKFLSNDFSLISKEVFEISKEEECFASRKLIKLLKEKDEYNKLGHILDNFNTIDNFTTKDIFSAINVCYLQYINDYKKKYKIDDIILNYKNLGRNIIYLKKDNSSLSLNYFINKTLFSSKTQKENMPYWYLLIFAKKKFDVTTEIFNDHICTYIIKHGLNIGFLHKNKSNEDHEYLTRLDLTTYNLDSESSKFNLTELEKSLETYKETKNISNLMDESKQKSAWKDFEHIMMFNGLMRYSTEHTLFLNVQKDLVYGFVIYRPYTNSIRDSFRIQKNKIKIATIKKAIDWEPSRYPIETLLRNIDKDSELFKIYSELYKVDCHKFSKITRENLNSFINFLKKEKVKAKILKEISKLNIAPVSEDKGRQFIEANYISLHTSYKEIYVLENCPEVDLIETVKELTKEEDKVECKTQDETIQWLIKKVLSHDVTLSNISSTIPMVMNETGTIKETDKPETEENNHLILLDFIKKSFKKNEKFTSSELLKKNKKIKKTEECIEILNELVENGDIFKITEKFLRNSTATKYFY